MNPNMPLVTRKPSVGAIKAFGNVGARPEKVELKTQLEIEGTASAIKVFVSP